jgi:hypothetical protein
MLHVNILETKFSLRDEVCTRMAKIRIDHAPDTVWKTCEKS